jgi:hypothetical protein
MRVPITCEGEACGKTIQHPRFRQRFCSDLCRLQPEVRERRLKAKADKEAQVWAASREGDELFRVEMLPCPFCGRAVRAQHKAPDGMSGQTWVTCCFGSMELFGDAAEALRKWNTRALSTQRSCWQAGSGGDRDDAQV